MARHVKIYCRKSTERGDSIPTQIDSCSTLALEKYGCRQPEIFIDSAISGTTHYSEREGLSELLSQLATGDVIICFDRSRLARNLLVSLQVDQVVQAIGATLCFVETGEERPEDPSSKLQSHMLGALAEFQALQTREKVKAALRYRKSQGQVLGRPPAFCGFNKDNTGYTLTNKAYLLCVRVNSLRYAGSTWEGVAKTLNQSGMYNTRTKPWSGQSIRHTVFSLRSKFNLDPTYTC